MLLGVWHIEVVSGIRLVSVSNTDICDYIKLFKIFIILPMSKFPCQMSRLVFVSLLHTYYVNENENEIEAKVH